MRRNYKNMSARSAMLKNAVKKNEYYSFIQFNACDRHDYEILSILPCQHKMMFHGESENGSEYESPVVAFAWARYEDKDDRNFFIDEIFPVILVDGCNPQMTDDRGTITYD